MNPHCASLHAGYENCSRDGGRVKNHLRVKPEFACAFKLIWVVQIGRKIFRACPVGQISGMTRAVPHSKEGRFAIVTNVERGMRWTQAAFDETRERADGEIAAS